MRPKPLAGLTVLDLTRLLPGPVCTMHLADMGADVLKIEDPGVGDYARTLTREAGGQANAATVPLSQFFVQVNRNKRFVTLDLKDPAGRQQFLEWAAQADVVVESFRPGVMARLGLDYATLSAANPRLVMCSVTGYGQDGPLAQAAGHDINYMGYAGALDQCADADGRPVLPNLQVGDLLGGALTAAMGILAAVIDARSTGRGRLVDVSMTDSVFAHNLMALIATNESGRPRPAGSDLLNGGVPCYGIYETADGRHLAVGALELKFWQRLCDALARPQWKERHWSLGQEPGGPDAHALQQELAALLRTRPRDDWAAELGPWDCCVTPVLRTDEALHHPLFAARAMALRVDHPEAGTAWQAALPVKFSEDRFEVKLHAASGPAKKAG
jgi:alpha-methylacyl-CoA racemase